MGYAPKSIRPGYFSTNDYTFQILAELGFSHGSLSCPTRILPECASVWAGAPLDIHYAHSCNRLLAGNLDFVEIPVTIDPDSHIWGGRQPLDLRVELIGPKDHWYTINKAVERQLEQNTKVPYISIYSHNIFDFSDEKNYHRETLLKMIKAVKEITADHSCRIIKATHEDVMTTYRRLYPLERTKAAELELYKRGRI
jgi:glutaredoxin